jgi:nucleotide-binding universal stress UspA family protein
MIRVLLPTDFSDNALNAASYACGLLKDETSVLFLLNAYTPPIYRVDYVLGSPGQLGLPDDYQYFAENNLKTFEEKLKKRSQNPKHSLVLHSAFNTLEDEITRVVNNENIGLIVMGTQGATGARELFMGSNTLHAIRKAEVPILAVPSDYQFKPLKELLFPTDLEIDFHHTDLHMLLKLSKLWKCKINILHVTPPDGLDQEQEQNKRTLLELLANAEIEYHDYPDQELVTAINRFHTKSPQDMFVMVQNKHTFMERLFIEPVIKNMGLHSEIPFMVLPYNKKGV